jgi:hypothetical protein
MAVEEDASRRHVYFASEAGASGDDSDEFAIVEVARHSVRKGTPWPSNLSASEESERSSRKVRWCTSAEEAQDETLVEQVQMASVMSDAENKMDSISLEDFRDYECDESDGHLQAFQLQLEEEALQSMDTLS